MRWRRLLFFGAAVLAAVGAISVFIAFGAPGGDDEPTLATPIPEELRGLGPPGTIEITTPAPLTPTPAAEGGRPDCQQDWAVYSDPDGHFSLCYPADWSATAEASPPLGTIITLQSPSAPEAPGFDAVLLTLYWKGSSPFDEGVISDRCGPATEWRDRQEVALSIAERSVPACVGDTTDLGDPPPEGPPLRGTFAEIPIGPDEGYIVFFLNEVGETSKIDGEPLSSIFRSLRVGQ